MRVEGEEKEEGKVEAARVAEAAAAAAMAAWRWRSMWTVARPWEGMWCGGGRMSVSSESRCGNLNGVYSEEHHRR